MGIGDVDRSRPLTWDKGSSESDKTVFQRYYLQEPPDKEAAAYSELLQILAEEYHRICDEFDASVCTARRSNEPVPATPAQAAAVNANARQVAKNLALRLPATANSRRDLRTAIFTFGLKRRQERDAKNENCLASEADTVN